MGFESGGLEHFVCSCHCIWCIGLSSLRGFVVVSEVENIVTLECIGTLELVFLSAYELYSLFFLRHRRSRAWSSWLRWPLEACGCGAQSLWCKASGRYGSLQFGCGDSLEHLYRFGDHPQGVTFVRVRLSSSSVP